MRTGDYVQIAAGQAHAQRNISQEPVIELIITNPRLGDWFQEAGRPITGEPGPAPKSKITQDTAHTLSVWPIPGRRKQMTETSATRTETNREIIRQAFDAWRQGTGAITDVFAPDMVWRDHPQGRQGRLRPARTTYSAGDRPGHRGTLRRTHLPGSRWPPARPARRRPDRPPDNPPRRDRQARRASHFSGTRSSPRRSTPASRSATCRKPLPTATREQPCAMTGPGLHWTGMPHTSSSPMSQVRRARPGKPRLLRLADSQPARRPA